MLSTLFFCSSSFSVEELHLSLNSYGIVSQDPRQFENMKSILFVNNNIKDWNCAINVGRIFPCLKSLIVSENPFVPVLDNDVASIFLELTTLSVEPMFHIFFFCSFSFSVEELHLSLNSYGTVSQDPRQFKNVKSLLFVNNNIKDWNCVINVGRSFPCLKSLIVSENPFAHVLDNDVASIFPELTTLSISQSKINDWNSVDILRKFPALTDVRLVKTPLLKKYGEDERRKLLISRLPNAKKLNGSVVHESERDDAERMFIRYYMDDESPPDRYHELVGIHGQLERLAEVDLSVKETADMVICFDDTERFHMSIELSQTAKELKRMLSKRVGMRSSDLWMYYFDTGGPHGREIMNTPFKQLYTYRMKDGDEIHLVRKGIGLGLEWCDEQKFKVVKSTQVSPR